MTVIALNSRRTPGEAALANVRCAVAAANRAVAAYERQVKMIEALERHIAETGRPV